MAETTNSNPSLPSLEPNSHCLSSRLDSLKQYIKEADVSSLNLSNMKLEIFEISSILECIADSQIIELDLSGNNLKKAMKYFYKLLTKTKVKTLNVSNCHLALNDVLRLTKILKDSPVTDLNLSRNGFNLYADRERSAFTFTSDLVKSHLTALNLGKCASFDRDEEALHFIQELRNTSLTHLNLSSVLKKRQRQNRNTVLPLFSNLRYTSITHLNLSGNCVGSFNFQNLGDSLKDLKLIELDLSWNGLSDSDADILFQALVGSTITSLNLASNRIKGDNNLNFFLTKTQITSVDLGRNPIQCVKMFSFPHFLRGSSVGSLKLDHCRLADEVGVKLMKSLEFSKLTELDVSYNSLAYDTLVSFSHVAKQTSVTHLNFSYNFLYSHGYHGANGQALVLFGELLAGSKVKHIDMSGSFWYAPLAVVAFLEKLKKSSVTSLGMGRLRLEAADEETAVAKISSYLEDAQLTHFDFSSNTFDLDNVRSLVTNLKYSGITHLNLTQCAMMNERTEALAACLKETCIIDLNLSCNKIGSRGAVALALSLQGANILSLNLNENEIKSDGLEALAQHAESTLITVLEVSKNPGNAVRLETVIWKNRRVVRKLVSFFKRIAPETGDNLFRFGEAGSNSNVDTFLEECLNFYKIVKDQSAAASVFANGESVAFSRDQISALLSDEFPKQLTQFVALQFGADVSAHVSLLKRSEELALNRVVELLLLNRPVYIIDKSRSILHPYVYSLLNEYKLPICNLDVEPQGIEKIIEYFSTFSNIEGAADVVKMLESIKPA